MRNTILKIIDVFPKNNQECLELHNDIEKYCIEEKIAKKPLVLTSISSGIAYVFETMPDRFIPENNIA